jgi:hypothetical protein
MKLLQRLALASFLVVVGARADAQTGTLRGVVTDSAGKPLAEADVAIVALHQLARSDAQGHFVFAKLPFGAVEVSVRRLGYLPQKIEANVSEGMEFSYSIALAPQPEILEAVRVSAAEKRRHLNVEEFYERRARGVGQYVTRGEILKMRVSQPSDVLRQTPGVQLVRVGSGHGIRFTKVSSMRRGGAQCAPTIWVDGQRADGLEIDDISLNDIEGIELYNGNSTTPAQFWRGNTNQCGTVVVWTRIPGTP